MKFLLLFVMIEHSPWQVHAKKEGVRVYGLLKKNLANIRADANEAYASVKLHLEK